MKNGWLFLLTCMLAGGPAIIRAQSPQQPLTQAEILEQIDRSASRIESLQCDFTQTKELSLLQDRMVSHGVMYYRQQGGLLRWEYLTPYRYTFILNGDRVSMQSGGRTDVVETSGNRMFREIARMMMNSLTGQCLTAASDFEVRVTVQSDCWVAELTPRRREMEQFFARVRLRFDPERQLVTRIEMIERNGDSTVIELKNIKRNEPIDETLFVVD